MFAASSEQTLKAADPLPLSPSKQGARFRECLYSKLVKSCRSVILKRSEGLQRVFIDNVPERDKAPGRGRQSFQNLNPGRL